MRVNTAKNAGFKPAAGLAFAMLLQKGEAPQVIVGAARGSFVTPPVRICIKLGAWVWLVFSYNPFQFLSFSPFLLKAKDFSLRAV